MKAFYFLLPFLAALSSLNAQSLIVQWEEGKDIERKVVGEESRRLLVPSLHIEQIDFASEDALHLAVKELSPCTCVRALEIDRKVDFRTDPNDDFYGSEQGNLIRAGFDRAWDLTSGGKTSEGTDIVVAILDAGFDVEHPDLEENLWVNPEEIPGDFRDNDGNGYVDDIHGWNMIDDSNVYPLNTHGTQVIGLLGAKGNNNRGVSGTNWDIKMMVLSISTIANIVESYGYILAQRQLYNSTDGREGAFIVATNASFGVEGGTCEDFAVWGGLYEELGRAGVLTAAATANQNWDVDMFGDMPTDCPTDFLIGVANVGTDDRLYRSSGFGKENIDLGAPGEESYSTLTRGRYGPFGSTSAAAPYVTGAIALLYSTPCPSLLDRARNDPASAALLVRDAILSSTVPNTSLTFRTATGGSLDVAEAQRMLAESCNLGEAVDFAITAVRPNPAAEEALLETNAIVFSESGRIDLFDSMGRLVRQQSAIRVGGATVTLRLNVAGLAPGWYSILVTERDRVARSVIVVR
ncbi:S8 family serine peptidase [Neolewinella agarilytica]|uniref:S8 family serine peptidase n=1 Tax=Neolewinella agarilytica TaxID=478744 RepID=UPI002355F328|nr:S8 family serine peptidase [Neolewinella agarilytica]